MRIILLIALLCLPVIASADVAQIIVPVTFTYEGRSVTANMAVDTGATVTTISKGLASRLGVSNSRHGGLAQMADGRAVRYQTATMTVAASTMSRNIEVNIMDYSANRQAEGMLGLNFLAEMTMTLDWRNKRIYWSE
jgi:predicted aspartyl protease